MSELDFRAMLDPSTPAELLEEFEREKVITAEKRRRASLRTARGWRCDRPACNGRPHDGRPYRHARDAQRPPEAWTRTWFVRGGRGSGKTWTASNALAELLVTEDPGEWGVVAPTFGDCRDVCMESPESGLIVALGGRMAGEGRLAERGPHIAAWNRSTGQLRLRNGSIVYSDGADDGAYRIQGHNLRGLWGDEVGLWKKWKAAWLESIRYAVRLHPAKIILTGTPKYNMPARVLVKMLVADPAVADVQLRTEDNVENLEPSAAAEFLSSRGTRLERQELEGELLEDVEGALWNVDLLDRYRIEVPDVGADESIVDVIYDLIQPTRIGMAIDPAVSYGEDSDEHGIVVIAKGGDGHQYVLADLSRRCPVTAWPPVAIEAHAYWRADRVIGEVNNGGDYIEATLRAGGYRGGYETVHATRGKKVRAEPVAQFTQQGRFHLIGHFPLLEAELTGWVPDEDPDASPNRLDAMVWAAVWLDPRLSSSWADVYKPRTDADKAAAAGTPARGWATVYQNPDGAGRRQPAPALNGAAASSEKPPSGGGGSEGGGYFAGTAPATTTVIDGPRHEPARRRFCACGDLEADHDDAGPCTGCSCPEFRPR